MTVLEFDIQEESQENNSNPEGEAEGEGTESSTDIQDILQKMKPQ